MEKQSYVLLCYAKIIWKIHIFNIKYPYQPTFLKTLSGSGNRRYYCLIRRFLLILKDLTLFTPVAYVPFPKNFLTNIAIILHFRIFWAFNKRLIHQHLPCFFHVFQTCRDFRCYPSYGGFAWAPSAEVYSPLYGEIPCLVPAVERCRNFVTLKTCHSKAETPLRGAYLRQTRQSLNLC